MNIYNREDTPQQSVYDAYNDFLFNSNKDVFYKMLTRVDLFNLVRNLNGDIVECGVFKGAGLALWLKLLERYSPHDIRKVIGFDFFDSSFVQNLEAIDKKMMGDVFSRCNVSENDISKEGIEQKLTGVCKFNPDRFMLIKGDISHTAKEFIKERPGFRISLLYLDLDLDEPTYNTLCVLWPRVVKGGVIVFDEYGYHVWSESNAVDKFTREHNLILHKTSVKSPTAYIIKS